MGQAKKLAEVQNGPIEGWNFGGSVTAENDAQFWNYLKPHISVAKDCGSNSDCYQNDGVYQLNGGSIYADYGHSEYYYKFVLSDGSVMWFRVGNLAWSSNKCSEENDECAVFWYDVNGNKSPNTFGKDIFIYLIKVNGVYPILSNECRKNSLGWGCSGYIIKHNNMNYLH